nr:MAG TPA: hypothetical protein [Caudoviricetes sp.]
MRADANNIILVYLKKCQVIFKKREGGNPVCAIQLFLSN